MRDKRDFLVSITVFKKKFQIHLPYIGAAMGIFFQAPEIFHDIWSSPV